MQVLINGVDAHPSKIVFKESLFDYSASLEFTLDYPAVFERCELRVDDTLPYVPVMVRQLTDTTYSYLCYPALYVDFLNAISQPLNVRGPLSALLDLLAMTQYKVVGTTQPQHWVWSSMRGKSIMDKLASEVVFVNGGCPTAHFDLTGRLVCMDVLERCTMEPLAVVSGVLTEGVSSTSAMNQIPGRARYLFFGPDTCTELEDVFLRDAGCATVYKYIVAEDRMSQVHARMQSMFWRRHVQNSVQTYTQMQNSALNPGMKVTMLQSPATYICISMTVESTDKGADISAVLMPTVRADQQLTI